jgi:hypothetical protein
MAVWLWRLIVKKVVQREGTKKRRVRKGKTCGNDDTELLMQRLRG